jgi:UDP-2-acetamido-2-deoxy-ribo-hexuluronate aminotransferase
MMKIQMVDLKSQYLEIKNEIDTAINNVLNTTAFINGKEVGSLRQNLANYLNCEYAITCGNGTDALQVALMSLDLKPGDEVITPNFTFIATAEAIALLKLKPIIVEVNPDTFTIDIEHLKTKITSKTKAIIPVHLFGQAANMEDIITICNNNDIAIIEDNAQAFGAEYTFSSGSIKKLGTIGRIGCTSFFPSKNLGCYGDGGALFTNDGELAEKISSIVNHGSKKKYYHDIIGVNSRLDTIQAAILDVKLKYIDRYNSARQNAAQFYNQKLKNISQISIPKLNPQSTHVYHQYTIKINNGDTNVQLQDYLKSKEIPSMIYYPKSIHQQGAFQDYVNRGDKYAVSEKLSTTVLSLPMHTHLDNSQLDYITDTIISYFN